MEALIPIKGAEFVPKSVNVEINKTKDDCIDRLPNDILRLILSKLPMREAAKTSLLSSRLRYIWASVFKFDLNFDVETLMGSKKRGVKLSFFHGMHKFASSVDQILQVICRGCPVNFESFRVRFYLDKRFSTSIDQWVDCAFTSSVRKFQLSLFTEEDREFYHFPFRCFNGRKESSLEHLNLQACIFKPPHTFQGFSALKTLVLKQVVVRDKHVKKLLSSSPRLERLSIVRCKHLVKLFFGSLSCQLQYLKIRTDFTCLLEKIEIDLASLTTFEYLGPERELSFGTVPKLVNMTLDFGSYSKARAKMFTIFSVLPSYIIQQLETLVLPLKWMVVPGPSNVPRLNNLRQLKIDVYLNGGNLLSLTYFLEAFPFLQKIHLDVCHGSGTYEKKRRPPRCMHKHLKVLEFSGFHGKHYEIEFVVFLLNNAVALESVVIDTRGRQKLHGILLQRSLPPKQWATQDRPMVLELLRKEVRPGVKLDVL